MTHLTTNYFLPIVINKPRILLIPSLGFLFQFKRKMGFLSNKKKVGAENFRLIHFFPWIVGLGTHISWPVIPRPASCMCGPHRPESKLNIYIVKGISVNLSGLSYAFGMHPLLPHTYMYTVYPCVKNGVAIGKFKRTQVVVGEFMRRFLVKNLNNCMILLFNIF